MAVVFLAVLDFALFADALFVVLFVLFVALFAVDFVVDFLDSALDFLDFCALFAESDFFVVLFFALDSVAESSFFAESAPDSAFFSFGSKYKIRPQCGQVTITSLLISSK